MVYLQGYWLQGGELTFWFQPFYRWIAGALHMLFGDSSMGEFWWDAICVMVFALFAHQAVAASNGFKWGLAAAVLCLTIAMQGPTWMFIGLGLSDIASAGFTYLASRVLSSARLRGDVPIAGRWSRWRRCCGSRSFATCRSRWPRSSWWRARAHSPLAVSPMPAGSRSTCSGQDAR